MPVFSVSELVLGPGAELAEWGRNELWSSNSSLITFKLRALP